METMRITVVGRDDHYVSSHGHVSYVVLFYLYDDPHVAGKKAGPLFIREANLSKFSYVPVPGDIVSVSFNRFGEPVKFAKEAEVCGPLSV